MSSRTDKKLRKYARQVMKADARQVWDSLCNLPVRKRCRLAWLMVRGKQGGMSK
jgi:hypothetical protein